MDLISAKVEAATMSNKGGKPAYVILVDDEFEVTHTPEPGADIYARFRGGSEDKEFLESMKPEMAEPKTTKKESKPAKKEAKNANNKTEPMETTTKKVAKKAAKKAPAKKAAKKAPAKKAAKKVAKKAAPAKKAASNGGKKVRSIYGFGVELLEMLKKGGAHPMESLTKKFKVENAAISFHIAAIKSHGYNVERTDKGYKLIK